MASGRSRGPWRRLRGLFDGWLTGWVRDREGSHPRAVYEKAIAERQRQYEQLKQGIAGVLYMRNKLEAEIQATSRELALVRSDLERAVRRGLDDVALELIRQKERLGEEQERTQAELEQVVSEVDAAKSNLARFRSDIHALEREKVRMLASLANARARKRIQAALDGLSTEAEEAALENVRAEIARLRFEGRLDQEIEDAGLRVRVRALRDEARFEAHRRELAELKQRQGTARAGRHAGAESRSQSARSESAHSELARSESAHSESADSQSARSGSSESPALGSATREAIDCEESSESRWSAEPLPVPS